MCVHFKSLESLLPLRMGKTLALSPGYNLTKLNLQTECASYYLTLKKGNQPLSKTTHYKSHIITA